MLETAMIKLAVRSFVLLILPLVIAACVTPQPRMLPPVVNHTPVAEAPAPPPPEPMMVMPHPIYKVGEAYQVGSTWYYPKEEADYNETGIASWYGSDFHGMLTANGEVFDAMV